MRTPYMQFAAAVCCLLSARQTLAVEFEWVTIGNPGNIADTEVMDQGHTTGYGAVSYEFRIGKFEVTNAQYFEFLNAVAATDEYGLFNPYMQSLPSGGIVRTGDVGISAYHDASAGTDVVYFD